MTPARTSRTSPRALALLGCLALALPPNGAAQSAASPAQGGKTDPALALLQSKGCVACHAIDRKLVGPAYVDVAKKYAGRKDAVNLLVTKVMKGGSGVWGPVPMPPQALSDAEAHQLVQWVLKQKPAQK